MRKTGGINLQPPHFVVIIVTNSEKRIFHLIHAIPIYRYYFYYYITIA